MTGTEGDELSELLDELRDEIAKTRRRARNWDGNLSDKHELKGRAQGMDIVVQEVEAVIGDV